MHFVPSLLVLIIICPPQRKYSSSGVYRVDLPPFDVLTTSFKYVSYSVTPYKKDKHTNFMCMPIKCTKASHKHIETETNFIINLCINLSHIKIIIIITTTAGHIFGHEQH